MRKVTVCFLLMLSSVWAFGQQQPQWKVVASVVMFNQSHADGKHITLLIPTEPSVYRLNVYNSGGAGTNNNDHWGFVTVLSGVDITGQRLSFAQDIICGQPNVSWMPQAVVSLKPDEPLTYYVEGGSPIPSCIYNLAITVEQLVQQ